MALTYMHIVLTIVLLRSDLSYQQEHKSVCSEPKSGCVGFRNKQDNFASFEKCLKICSVQKVPGAESATAHLCLDELSPCTSLTYYKIFSHQDHFLDYTDCLQGCHMLTNGDGKVSDQVDVCESEKEECFSIATKNSVETFMNCYLDCQAIMKDEQTRRNYNYICQTNLSDCVSTVFYTLPEEAKPHNVLKKCYQACGLGGATTSTADLFKCEQSSQQCVPCSDGEEDCVAESACKATCKEDTSPLRTDLFRCDKENQKCVPCTMNEENCMEDLECEVECEDADDE